MSDRDPLITVVMPVYNAGTFLIDAVASIIEQSYQDWAMICVNDGSQDDSGRILNWFAEQDSRIRVVHQSNAGLVDAQNHGCRLATSPLICRMDSDDLALPNRLAEQADFLRTHPNCVVVGGAILEVDADGDPLCVSRLPTAHDDIVENLLERRSGHYHPTTMYRTEAFHAVGGYRKEVEWVDDHDLWLRMAQRGQLSNLRSVLLCYRQHSSSVCWQHSAQQRMRINQVLREAYRARGREVPEHLIAEPTQVRSAAGPGKWARAAAKGGYCLSVYKHLHRLLQSDARPSYKSRMLAESVARLTVGYPRRLLTERKTCVPSFSAWHERANRSLSLAETKAA